MRLLKSIFGWFFAAFGLIGFAQEIDKVLAGTATRTVGGFAIAGVFLALGVWMIYSVRKGAKADMAAMAQARLGAAATADTLVLQVAVSQGGKVTPAEVAAHTPLSFSESKAELDKLADAGACRVNISSEGVVVYHFPEFESARAKEGSFVREHAHSHDHDHSHDHAHSHDHEKEGR